MKKILFVCFLSLCFSIAAFAGNNKTVAVKGKVTDKHGNALVGAKVVLEDSKTIVYTDFDGYFIFPEVSKTNHRIKVSMISFEEEETVIDLQSNSASSNLSIALKSR